MFEKRTSWALLTRNQCRVSDTQVTIKTLRPLVIQSCKVQQSWCIICLERSRKKWLANCVLIVLSILFLSGCQDSPSAECSLYNSDVICDSQGKYYLWAKENCPLHCGFCQGIYIIEFIIQHNDINRLGSNQLQ